MIAERASAIPGNVKVRADDRIAEIDLFRFVAALAVVFYHYAFRGYAADDKSILPYPLLAPVAKYGYLGVELFFMISGFVILMTASRGDLRSFVASRVARLYPAFWACCGLTFLVVWAFGAPRLSATFPQFLVNLTMFAGFVGVESIDGAYWSLYVEMKFYFLIGLVLAFRRIDRIERVLTLWLVATAVLTVFPVARLRGLLITEYAAYFIGGAALYLGRSKGFSALRIALVATAWPLALANSLAALPYMEEHFHVTMNRAAVAVIVTLLFVVMTLVALRKAGPLARMNWTLVGALTYPLYLLHQQIGYAAFNRLYPAVDAHVLLWGMVAAMLLLAYAVHAWIEKPCAPALKRRVAAILAPRAALPSIPPG